MFPIMVTKLSVADMTMISMISANFHCLSMWLKNETIIASNFVCSLSCALDTYNCVRVTFTWLTTWTTTRATTRLACLLLVLFTCENFSVFQVFFARHLQLAWYYNLLAPLKRHHPHSLGSFGRLDWDNSMTVQVGLLKLTGLFAEYNVVLGIISTIWLFLLIAN